MLKSSLLNLKKSKTAEHNAQYQLTIDETRAICQQALEEIYTISNEVGLSRFLQEAKQIPDEVKIKLYDFLVHYNVLDASMDQLNRKIKQHSNRNVSSNIKEAKSSLSHLNYSERLNILKSCSTYDEEDLEIKLEYIEDATRIRDRIAHAVPYWYAKYHVIFFYSYDAVFWKKQFNKMRGDKENYNNAFYKDFLSQKTLDDKQFTVIVYHLYEVNTYTNRLQEINTNLVFD